MIAGTNKSDKTVNITGIVKIHLECDCIDVSVVNGIRRPVLYNFALSSPPGHIIHKEPRIKLFKTVNKSVLSDKSFYLEDNDQKLVDFNGETINFTSQLIEIK